MFEQENTNKLEEKTITENVEENNNNNTNYLQKLLSKNNISNSIILSSVNESLPSFTKNMRDILTKEENKEKAMNYLIKKEMNQNLIHIILFL